MDCIDLTLSDDESSVIKLTDAVVPTCIGLTADSDDEKDHVVVPTCIDLTTTDDESSDDEDNKPISSLLKRRRSSDEIPMLAKKQAIDGGDAVCSGVPHIATLMKEFVDRVKRGTDDRHECLRTQYSTGQFAVHFCVQGDYLKWCARPKVLAHLFQHLQRVAPFRGKNKRHIKATWFKRTYRVWNSPFNRKVAFTIVSILDDFDKRFGQSTISFDDGDACSDSVLRLGDSHEAKIVAEMTSAYNGTPLMTMDDRGVTVINYNCNRTSRPFTATVLEMISESRLPYAQFVVSHIIAIGTNSTGLVEVNDDFSVGHPCAGVVSINRHLTAVFSEDGKTYVLSDSWKQAETGRNDQKQFGLLREWFEQRGCQLTRAQVKVIQGNEGSCAPAAVTKMLNAARALHEGADVWAAATGLQRDGSEVVDWIKQSTTNAVLAQRLYHIVKYG